MNGRMMTAAAAILVSAFLMTAGAGAQEPVNEQEMLQEMNRTGEVDRQQERVRLNQGAGGTQGAGQETGPGNPDETGLQTRQRERAMNGAENARGEAVRTLLHGEGEDKAIKNAEKTGSGDGVMEQKRKRDKKQLRKEERSMRQERRQSTGVPGKRGR